MTKCPTCHGSGSVPDGFKMTTTMRSLTTRAPRDEWSIRSVYIPRQHATDAALFGGGIMSFVAYGVCHAMDVPPDQIVSAIIAAGGISALLSFGIVRTVATMDDNRLRWRVETMLDLDLDGDGHKGEPPAQNDATETDITVKERSDINGKLRRIVILNWPCKKDNIPAIAQRLLNGQLALVDWGKGTLLSVPKFKRVRDSMIKARYGEWNNQSDHTKGWHLTASGRVLLGENAPNRANGIEPGVTHPAG